MFLQTLRGETTRSLLINELLKLHEATVYYWVSLDGGGHAVYKNSQLLFNYHIDNGCVGIGAELCYALCESFCKDNIICANSCVLNEQGNIQYELPAAILNVQFYNSFPWVIIGNKKSQIHIGSLFNVLTRQWIKNIPIIHTRPYCKLVISPCHSTILFDDDGSKWIIFLYKVVTANLSTLLGVLPVDALNDVYRFIKC